RKSRARVEGSHDTYVRRDGLSLARLRTTFSPSPLRGGSATTRSGRSSEETCSTYCSVVARIAFTSRPQLCFKSACDVCEASTAITCAKLPARTDENKPTPAYRSRASFPF